MLTLHASDSRHTTRPRDRTTGRHGRCAGLALFAVVVFAVVVCAQLFALRQQRLELMHEVASLRSGISRGRHALWDLETGIAESTHPAVLRQAIARAQLRLEPVVSPALMRGRQMTTADTKPALSLHR